MTVMTEADRTATEAYRDELLNELHTLYRTHSTDQDRIDTLNCELDMVESSLKSRTLPW